MITFGTTAHRSTTLTPAPLPIHACHKYMHKLSIIFDNASSFYFPLLLLPLPLLLLLCMWRTLLFYYWLHKYLQSLSVPLAFKFQALKQFARSQQQFSSMLGISQIDATFSDASITNALYDFAVPIVVFALFSTISFWFYFEIYNSTQGDNSFHWLLPCKTKSGFSIQSPNIPKLVVSWTATIYTSSCIAFFLLQQQIINEYYHTRVKHCFQICNIAMWINKLQQSWVN